MQQCCHLSTYIVPFHTRKVNRNFTKKREQRAKDSAGFLAILTKSTRGRQGTSFRAYRTYVRIVVYSRNIRSEQMFVFDSEHMFFMPEHTFLFRLSGFRTNVRYCIEQTFFICKNIRSLLQEQTFGSFANICLFAKERLFVAGQTKSPSRRRGDFIQFDVITE